MSESPCVRILSKLVLVPAILVAVIQVPLWSAKPQTPPDLRWVKDKNSKLWQQAKQQMGRTPLYFEPNNGQADPNIQVISRGAGFVTLLTGDQTIFLNSNTKVPVRMQLMGSPQRGKAHLEEKLSGISNYFYGKDPAKWRTDVPHYGRVRFESVYPGIDLVYYSTAGRMEYDFVVAPNSDPSRIRFQWHGVEKSRIDEAGDLVLTTAAGDIRHKRPVVYQQINGEKKEVASHYRQLGDNVFGFEVEQYRREYALTIDPTIFYSTFIGGAQLEDVTGIALDGTNNVYISGVTRSNNFPSLNPYQAALSGTSDGFVTKLLFTGGELGYSTFFGGDRDDQINALALDALGNVYITGETNSSDFPTTPRAFERNVKGPVDAFVAKLSFNGNQLMYSTMLGDFDSDERAYGIAVNSANQAVVVGITSSSTFPTTVGAYDRLYNGSFDMFITEVDELGEKLIFSTFLGGNQVDFPLTLTTDSVGNIYVGGYTNSPDFPTTPGAYRRTMGGIQDGFLIKLSHTGDRLLFSTLVGGDGVDSIFGISIDPGGRILVAGQSFSQSFPTTTGAYQTTNRGVSDVFLMKLSSTGAHAMVSTLLGTPHLEYPIAVKNLDSGYILVGGYTESNQYPTTPDAFGFSSNFNGDGFLTVLAPLGNAITYSTVLGGVGSDIVKALAQDSAGDVYVSGYTQSTVFPTTSDAFDRTFNGISDGYVMKLSGFPNTECVAPVTPSGTAYPALGGGGGIGVTNQGCNWYALTSVPWVTLSGNPLTVGGGALNYTVATNADVNPRAGLIQVAGNQVHLLQKGTSEAPPFGDIPANHGFVDYVRIIKAANVTNGCGNNNYCPNDFTTRGQMAAFIIRSLLGSDTFQFPTAPYFTDVPATHPFFKWIQKLRQLNITTGCNLIEYCPEAPVTRGQMAAFLVRSKYGNTFRFPTNPFFSDVPTTNFFFSHIQKLRQTGVTLGCGGTQYCVDANTTRAEMSAFLTRMYLTPW